MWYLFNGYGAALMGDTAMQRTNMVRFREVQVGWEVLPGVVIGLVAVGGVLYATAVSFREHDLPRTIFRGALLAPGLALCTLGMFRRMVTEIRDDGLYVTHGWIGRATEIPPGCWLDSLRWFRKIQLDDVVGCDVVARERTAPQSTDCFLGGKEAVRISYANGKHLLIGSRRPEELAEALTAFCRGSKSAVGTLFWKAPRPSATRVAASPPIPSGLTYEASRDTDVISWSNRAVLPREEKILVGLGIAVAFCLPVMGFGIVIMFVGGLRALAFPFLFLFTLLPLILILFFLYFTLTVYGSESIRVSNDRIELIYRGPPWNRTKRINRAEVEALSLERFPWPFPREAAITLNLSLKSRFFERRRVLAHYMNFGAKRQLFHLLRRVFEKRSWDIEYRGPVGSPP